MREKNSIITLIILLLAGIVFGGWLGEYLAKYPSWGWLNYGLSFGMDAPFSLEFQIIHLTFSIAVKITIAGIIGMALGWFVYKRM